MPLQVILSRKRSVAESAANVGLLAVCRIQLGVPISLMDGQEM
jgi:hypothetical protein